MYIMNLFCFPLDVFFDSCSKVTLETMMDSNCSGGAQLLLLLKLGFCRLESELEVTWTYFLLFFAIFVL